MIGKPNRETLLATQKRLKKWMLVTLAVPAVLLMVILLGPISGIYAGVLIHLILSSFAAFFIVKGYKIAHWVWAALQAVFVLNLLPFFALHLIEGQIENQYLNAFFILLAIILLGYFGIYKMSRKEVKTYLTHIRPARKQFDMEDLIEEMGENERI